MNCSELSPSFFVASKENGTKKLTKGRKTADSDVVARNMQALAGTCRSSERNFSRVYGDDPGSA